MKAIRTSMVAFILFACACAQQKTRPEPAEPPPIQYYTHTISAQGETLASIARWYTGSANNWEQILEHNPGMDVKRMRIGSNVQIPNDMLVRSTPMPKPAVDKTTVAKQETLQEENQYSDAASDDDEWSTTTTVTASSSVSYSSSGVSDEEDEQTAYEAPSDEEMQQVFADIETYDYSQYEEEYAAAETPAKKGFLSKFQEAAMKAQQGSPASGTTDPVAKAQMDSAITEQIQEATAEELEKTREQLIQELAQDY